MYKSVWRCRLCGEKFLGNMRYYDHEKDSLQTYIKADTHIQHDCYGGDMGLADFLGFRYFDEVKHG